MSSEVQVDINNQSMGKVTLHGNNFINDQPYAIVLVFKIIKIINSNFWRKSYMCASFLFFFWNWSQMIMHKLPLYLLQRTE